MQIIDKEVKKYIDGDSLENIENNYITIVGLESDLTVINENDKCLGRIILMHNCSKKVSLNFIVEFNKVKIKWRHYREGIESGFYLIDPYWVRSYSPDPKIEVPVRIYKPKTNTVETEMRKLTYKQFQQNRLMEFYVNENWKHKWVASYENFRSLYASSRQKYLAINATVKNYFIKQAALERILSVVDNKKRQIKSEWLTHMNQHIQQDQSIIKVQKLFEEFESKKENATIIKFKKMS